MICCLCAPSRYRISFAFNLAGDWHDTSGLTLNLDTAPNSTVAASTSSEVPPTRTLSDEL
eukprot:m.171401 g.171401  ORF g.171401 m.171401 type:complete len:60 (-) comp24235_c0_seq2:233-412(-)